MASNDYNDHAKHEDLKVLHGMGYAQELSRSMSKFSNFAISFSIICILSGGINSFAQAISSVGGAGAGIGWIVGCIISGMFALSMAQIASAFPTAGGLYHWASILGNRFVGWLAAWLNLLGLITSLAPSTSAPPTSSPEPSDPTSASPGPTGKSSVSSP